jgi:hypothetical protein
MCSKATTPTNMKSIGFSFLAQVMIKDPLRMAKLLHAELQNILSTVFPQFSDLQHSLNIMNDNLKSTNSYSFQFNAEDKYGATSTRRKGIHSSSG